MSASLTAALVPGRPPSDEIIQAVTRLEAELERQLALREAADRAVARTRDRHEDAYERLLLRCRSLEEEKVGWTDANLRSIHDRECLEREHAAAMVRQLEDLSQTFDRRSSIVEEDHRTALEHVEREHANALARQALDLSQAFDMRASLVAQDHRTALERIESELAAA